MKCVLEGFKEKRNTKIILLIPFIKTLQFQQTARSEKEKKNESPKTIFITTKKWLKSFIYEETNY
jgi:glycopeptide antibiotics resistance protein